MQDIIITGPSGPISRNAEIAKRRDQMPVSQRGIYDRAVHGKSRASAIKAFCYECCGYDRTETKPCTDPGCPLWLYRPGHGVSSKAKKRPSLERQATNEVK